MKYVCCKMPPCGLALCLWCDSKNAFCTACNILYREDDLILSVHDAVCLPVCLPLCKPAFFVRPPLWPFLASNCCRSHWCLVWSIKRRSGMKCAVTIQRSWVWIPVGLNWGGEHNPSVPSWTNQNVRVVNSHYGWESNPRHLSKKPPCTQMSFCHVMSDITYLNVYKFAKVYVFYHFIGL